MLTKEEEDFLKNQIIIDGLEKQIITKKNEESTAVSAKEQELIDLKLLYYNELQDLQTQIDNLKIENNMSNGEPSTVKELYIFVKQKFETIENTVKDIRNRPNDAGKWLVRVAVTGALIVGILNYLK